MNYAAIDFAEIAKEQTHLSFEERNGLLSVLWKQTATFQGKKGDWTGPPVLFEMIDGAKPFYARPYRIPQSLHETLKKKINRLVDEGVLKPIKASEWTCPAFAIPKKDKAIRVVSDLRGINKLINQKPYLVPLIQDIMPPIGKFRHATTIDLVMGYYSMRLSSVAKEKCVLYLPLDLYQYQVLPMALVVSSDVFQEALGNLMLKLENVYCYLDDIIVIGNWSFQKHMAQVDEVLQRLRDKGLQVHLKKSAWVQDSVEYLGYIISREGIRPQDNKIQEMLDLSAPMNQKYLCGFIGMVNFYKNMWPKRSSILGPLTDMTGKGKKFTWAEVHQNAFDSMKKLMAEGALLAFPDFTKKFTLHTDASDLQIGGVLSQEGKPIGFFSKKFNPAQRKYTVTQRELLAIVETLKHFRNTIFGHDIEVFTDHQSLTYENTDYPSDHILQQHLTIEEYGSRIINVPGDSNVVADSLSRLPTTAGDVHSSVDKLFATEQDSIDTTVEFLLDDRVILREQATDNFLQN